IADGTFWDDLGMTDNGYVDVTFNWENSTSGNTVGSDAFSWDANRIDVFVRGGGNDIYHKWYDNGTWYPAGKTGGFEDLGGDAYSGPAVCSWGVNRLDVFVRGGGDALYHKYYNGSSWVGWENLGGTLSAGVDAVSW